MSYGSYSRHHSGGKSKKRSFDIKRANKDHICIWCEKTIPKGTRYYSKGGKNEALGDLLETEIGFPIYVIKLRTHLRFCDYIAWHLCSLKCLSDFSLCKPANLPPDVKARMDERVLGIVNRVKEALHLVTALGGKEKTSGEFLFLGLCRSTSV